MTKLFNIHRDKLSRFLLLILPSLILMTVVLFKCQESVSEPQLSLVNSTNALIAKPTNQGVPMPGDTIFRPIRWGAELRVVPNVIYAGMDKKYGRYWFCKTMAYQLVKPARYQQDSVRERVAFADSSIITNNDTFYICRRIIL